MRKWLAFLRLRARMRGHISPALVGVKHAPAFLRLIHGFQPREGDVTKLCALDMKASMEPHFTPPPPDCPLCPRLVAFREENKLKFPHFYNGAVPPFGGLDAQMLVVGLAPGLKGANATGRPFTGDFAGDVLYEALEQAGMARGNYQKRADDGFELINVRISNAVRCVPPQNKPLPEEAATCNPFLVNEIAAMPNLRLILSLGATSHQAVLKTFKCKQSANKFGHGAVHVLQPGLTLLDSYHTSRYNIQTGTLTRSMFAGILVQAAEILARPL